MGKFPLLEKGGLDLLYGFLDKWKHCRFVVIDTLARARAPRKSHGVMYEQDVKLLGDLQVMAHHYHIAALVVHHLRKSSGEELIDEVSGTAGLTGTADGVLILKRPLGSDDGILHITGRDIPERELAVRLDIENGVWLSLGEASTYRLSEERKAIQDILKDSSPLSPHEIAKSLGAKPLNVRQLLKKMTDSGQIKRGSDGKYAIPDNADNGDNGADDQSTEN